MFCNYKRCDVGGKIKGIRIVVYVGTGNQPLNDWYTFIAIWKDEFRLRNV